MGLFGTTKRTLVVDMTAVQKSKGVRGNPAPRQQLQILRGLSRVVQREKVNVTAIIVGQPLNKAPNNKIFEGVRVRYAKTSEKLGGAMIKAVKQAGSNGVLVSEDAELEKKAIRSGLDTLRVSTFRKLMDDSGEQGASANNGANRERNNGRKPRRDRSARPERKKKKSKEEKREQQQDEISQMIDLVD